jgi:DNA-binding GntR family transcriptional regulator
VNRRTRSRTLGTSAYDHLRRSIVTLRLAPGTTLVEGDICARLHVSRTPVRAALERLHQDGLVTMTGSRPRGRAVVASVTLEDMRELFLLVGALDGVAARLAAGLPPALRTRLVARLRSANDDLARVGAGTHPSDIPRAQLLDLEFHRLYEEAASGPRLLGKLQALHAQRERYVRLYTQALVHAHSLEESLGEHRAIVAAIEAGDGDAAERAAAFNHTNALTRFARTARLWTS